MRGHSVMLRMLPSLVYSKGTLGGEKRERESVNCECEGGACEKV